MKWKAVLFDLDGTLIETAPEIADAVNDTLRHFQLGEVTQAQVDGWIGQGTRELLVLALAHQCQCSVQEIRESATLHDAMPVFETHYRSRCGTRSRLYPHVRETITALRAKGCRIAIVTNKESHFTEAVLRAHGLQGCFDQVISGDTYPTKKPDPSSVISTLAQWNIPAQDALFVGDSSIDAATARNAGMPVWLLPYGYNMGQSVEACKPDRVIGDCTDLLKNEGDLA